MKEEAEGWTKVTNFIDTKGRKIARFEVVHGKDKGKIYYTGTVFLTVANKGTGDKKNLHKPFEFRLPEDRTTEWMFNNFDELCDKAVKEFAEETKRRLMEEDKENAKAALKAAMDKITNTKDSENKTTP